MIQRRQEMKNIRSKKYMEQIENKQQGINLNSTLTSIWTKQLNQETKVERLD